MAASEIRVLLADDNDLFRELLRSALEEDFGLAVIAEATNGREAVHLSRELRPDVVVVDLRMPDLGGEEAARRIVDDTPGTRVVVMTMDDRAARKGRLAQGAVTACYLKDRPVEELVRIVREAIGG